jgi:GntR family transcriptional regulator
MAEHKILRFGPISAAAPGPLYEQIVGAVKREVAAGRLQPGEPLPSVRTLAAELVVSIITVKRAYEELEREGILFSRQGLGTFIAESGVEETRRVKRQAARDALRQAVAAGREGGLTNKDLIDWLKKEL